MKNEVDYTTGVVVGRFQVDELHEGHIDFLNKINDSYQKAIIFLGLSQIKCSKNNPLDFISRKQMIQERFPDMTVLYIADTYSDANWSGNLDNQIQHITGINESIVLLGNRDSFIKYYSGKHDCIELEQEIFVSGTQVRKQISNTVKGKKEFRQGVIWATENQYPACHPTVDIAIIKGDKILLAKRDSEPLYRLPGGFVEPGETFETAALREAKEETGLDVDTPKYIESFVVDDWRYRSEVNKITTSLFTADYLEGTPQPMDDVDELRFFDLNLNLLHDGLVVDEHRLLIEALLEVIT